MVMKKYLLIISLFGLLNFANAQSMSKLNKQLFERDMVDASQILKKRLIKGDSTVLAQYAYVLLRLNKTNESYANYKLASQKGLLKDKQHMLDYVSLSKQNKIEISQYQTYINKLNDLGLKGFEFNESIYNLSEVKNLCINSDADEFGLTTFNKQRLFSSNRMSDDANIQNAFLQTFAINKDCDVLVKNITSETKRFHIGPLHVTADDKHVFATVSRSKRNAEGIYQLEILWSTQTDKAYSEYISLPFCSPDYSVQHAYFDEKAQVLYFSSNMKGGKGGFDIYKSKLSNSNWTTPEPVNEVNTAADEVFPTLQNGNLYYSSVPANGFGGLDILMLKKGEPYSQILPAPINSTFDDFYFQSDNDLNGTFCSNRLGGKGGDDIYSYNIDTTPYTVCLQLLDSVTQKANTGVEVNYVLAGKNYTVNSDNEGKVCFTLPATTKLLGNEITFNANKSGYKPASVNLALNFTANRTLNVTKSMILVPVVVAKAKIKVGQDLGKLLNLNPIYFDLGKWDVRPDAALELDKIVRAMQEFPTLVIELGSHTDSRSSTKFNQTLSQKRAESSGKYILSNGIDPKRLTWKGYGESKLLNKCKDGVKCSEEDHSKNRRTEFKIIKM
jgi:outer membrane protein OmpA-like peptidoglycan-associated protein